MDDWKLITTKYTNKCCMCNETIEAGEEAHWMQGIGIKHYPECGGFREDDSRLIVFDD